MLRLGAERDEVAVVDDQRGCPTYVGHLAAAMPAVVELPFGVYHVAAAGDCTWADFAEAIFEEAGLDCRVRRITTAEFGARAPRPAYSVLRSREGRARAAALARGPARVPRAAARSVAFPRCACSSPAAPGSSAPTSSGGSLAAGDEVVVLDKLTYAGNRGEPRRRRARVPRGRHRRCRTTSPTAARGLRRDRQLRRRDARRPLDPRRDRLRAHRVLRHAGAARAGARERRRASCRSRPTRSTATSSRAARAKETDPLEPSSPYCVAKAAGDLHIPAYVRTFGVNASITRGSNTYGPNQYPEKLIPLFVTNALEGEPLPLYGDGRQVRDWLYVEDHCAGIELVLREGAPGEAYNVGGGEERENIDVANAILELTRRRPVAAPARRPTAPATTAATRSTRSKLRGARLGAAACVRGRASRRRSTGTASTATGGSRSSRASSAPTTSASTPPASPAERPRAAHSGSYKALRAAAGAVATVVAGAPARSSYSSRWRRSRSAGARVRGTRSRRPTADAATTDRRPPRRRPRRRVATTTAPAPPIDGRRAPRRSPSSSPATAGGTGVGMAQWGALGYAQHGWSYDADPRALLPRHDARAAARARPCASCCSKARARDARLRGGLVASPTRTA